jgi:hypothetical protein
MVTPMMLATSTPVGVSTARYMRATATTAMTPATTPLPICRNRPCGTRAYSMLTSRPVSTATGSSG